VNKPTGNFPGDRAETDSSPEDETAAAGAPPGASDPAPPRRPSDPPEAWEERTEEALPISEQADPVELSMDEGDPLPDEVTPPIAVAPRARELEEQYQDELYAHEAQRFREQDVEVTQEISPEELEIQPVPRRGANAASAASAASAAMRVTPAHGETPQPSRAQVALSDLFDSGPGSGVTLEPPNVAEFASSRPPPGAPGPQRPMFEGLRRPTPTGTGVVALPSIPVSDKSAEAPRPSALAPGVGAAPGGSPPGGSAPGAAASQATRVPSQPAAASSPLRERPPSPARDVGAQHDATPAVPRAGTPTPPRAGDKTPAPPPAAAQASDDSEPLTQPKPSPSEPPGAAHADAGAPSAAAITAPPAAGPRRASYPAASQRPRPPPVEPQSAITEPIAPRQPQSASQLPSVVLAPSIEQETELPNLRAMRSTRATVRISSVEALGLFKRPPLPASAPVSSAPQISVRALSPASVRALVLRHRPWSWVGAGVVVALLLVWLLWPSKGALMVTVSGPGGGPVAGVSVLIDDKPVCDSSPCRVADLSEGLHRVRASAQGMADTGEESVSVTSGGEAVHNIRLAPTAAETGGVQVSAGDKPLTLVLDGKVVGPLPQKLLGLTPGEHWIKLESTDGEPALEKGIVVGSGEIVQIEPARLKSDKVIVTIQLSPDSDGATVTLNDAFLLDFPAELELTPGEPHELHASKPGFKDYKTQINVAPGETSKHITVDLEPAGGGRSRPRSHARAAAAATNARAARATAPAVAASTAPGLLNINSTPPSSVILNGRPLGMTPRVGIEVPGNSMQTVIFVHPTMGRRRAQQIVPAGKTKTIAIRF
jgi:serine/threonine-protein kinase